MRALIWTALKASRGVLVRIILALLVLAVAEAGFLLLVGPFMRGLFGAHDAMIPLAKLLPPGLSRFFSSETLAIELRRAQLALVLPMALVIAAFCRGVAAYVYQLAQHLLALDLAATLREALFRALLGESYADISVRSPAEWMSVIMNDVMYLQSRFSELAASLLRDGVLVLSCFLALTLTHWPTAVLLLVLSPLLVVGLGRTGRRISRFTDAWQQELRKMAAQVLDMRERFLFIRAQHGEARETERFGAVNQSYLRLVKSSILVRSLFAPGLEFLGFVIFAATIYAIGQGWWLHDFGPDRLLQFFAALGLMLRPLRSIGEQFGRFEETRGAMRAPQELLAAAKDKVVDRDLHMRTVDSKSFATGLNIAVISVGHQQQVVLSSTDIPLQPGRAIAIIGASGSGKSTLLKTLAGLLPPLAWEATLPWSAVRDSANFVSQFPFLFDDTIRANLGYGLAEPPSSLALQKVLQLLNMEAAVSAAGGLDARVQALGTSFSGGQVQRLCIARALLRDKPLLLLDEATSALDPQNEHAVISAVLSACRQEGRMLLVVSHRTSYLGDFDSVWWVQAGAIIRRGHHRDLLAAADYRAFVMSDG